MSHDKNSQSAVNPVFAFILAWLDKPHSELHKKKRMKNFAILGGLTVWIALIVFITMIKMGALQ